MNIETRITPEIITKLAPKQIFVFGANEAYIHGKGAAKTALKWGAKYGHGLLCGQTYGIPTKDKTIRRTLSIDEIKVYVDLFIDFAKNNPDYIFLVTPIGCGLAGLNANDIAPLFIEAIQFENIYLPQMFWNVLINE
jgi:hypothetical protein